MSVASQIQRIKDAVADAYTSVNEKGGTLPESQTVANLAAAVDSISTGATTTPLSVTANGTYTAPTGQAYTPVTVNVPSSSMPTAELPYLRFINATSTTVDLCLRIINSCTLAPTLYYTSDPVSGTWSTVTPDVNIPIASNSSIWMYGVGNTTFVQYGGGSVYRALGFIAFKTSTKQTANGTLRVRGNIAKLFDRDLDWLPDGYWMQSMFADSLSFVELPDLYVDIARSRGCLSAYKSRGTLAKVGMITAIGAAAQQFHQFLYNCTSLTSGDLRFYGATTGTTCFVSMLQNCSSFNGTLVFGMTLAELSAGGAQTASNPVNGCSALENIYFPRMTKTEVSDTVFSAWSWLKSSHEGMVVHCSDGNLILQKSGDTWVLVDETEE